MGGKGLIAGLQGAQIKGEEAAYIRREISVYTEIDFRICRNLFPYMRKFGALYTGVRPYFFCLTSRFITNRMTIAPMAPVRIEPIQPSPREVLKTFSKSHEPTPLHRIPTTIFPRSPRPLPR